MDHPSASLASLSRLLDALHTASGLHIPHAFHSLSSAISETHTASAFDAAVDAFSQILASTSPNLAPPDPPSRLHSTRLARHCDYIALRAVADWAAVVLHPTHSAAIASRLHFDILRLVFDNTLGVFLNGTTVSLPPAAAPDPTPALDGTTTPDPTAGQSSPAAHPRVALQHAHTRAYDAELNVWPRVERARRHVLQVALSARYGNALLAPKAAMVAGAPLILHISEKTASASQVVRVGDGDRRQCSRDDALREWNDIALGLCVFEALEVESASSLRGAVGSTFKDAVWNKGLSPTLIVLHLDPDTTLCDGVGVLRAICDGYGSRLHVEGPATAMFLAGREAENLEHDVALSASSAHSIIMDVAAWFGVPDAAVVSSVRLPAASDPAQDAASLRPVTSGQSVSASSLYPLWFLLECSGLQRRANILKSACKHLNDIIDSLLEHAHLIEYRLVGCGAYLLLSYAQHDASPAEKSSLNEAMLAHVSRHKSAGRFQLQIVHYGDMHWICFSPLLGLESNQICEEISADDVQMLTSLLVAAVKRVEIAKAGRAAFVASMKQCADVELVGQEDDIGSEGPLQFGALRVVPLGLAAGNGHWQRDSEMCEQVEKFTYALASCLEQSHSTRFEGVLVDYSSGEQKPLIYIGPVVSIERRVPSADKLDAAERGARPSWTFFGTNAKMGMSATNESSELRNERAREIAREAAEEVASLVQTVITNTKAMPDETVEDTVVLPPTLEPVQNDVGDSVDNMNKESTIGEHSDLHSISAAEPVVNDASDAVGASAYRAENDEGTDRVRSPTSEPSSDEIRSIVPENSASPKPKDVPQRLKAARANPSPLWKMFLDRAFGAREQQSDSESSSLRSDEDLEDDYFRV